VFALRSHAPAAAAVSEITSAATPPSVDPAARKPDQPAPISVIASDPRPTENPTPEPASVHSAAPVNQAASSAKSSRVPSKPAASKPAALAGAGHKTSAPKYTRD